MPPMHSQLQPPKTMSIALGGAHLPVDGIVPVECRMTKHKALLDFHITSLAGEPIMGGDACEEQQLLIITAAGQRADDAKIKAIVGMPTPQDKQSTMSVRNDKIPGTISK